MSDKNRHPHIAPNGLLSLGNISGLLQEVNGQQHVVGSMDAPQSVQDNSQAKGKDAPSGNKNKQKQSSKAKTGKANPEISVMAGKVKSSQPKSAKITDTFSYVASRLQSDCHRIDRKADKVAYIRPEIITAFRQCYREKATQAVNEVLRKYIEDNKERLREQRTDKGSLLDR